MYIPQEFCLLSIKELQTIIIHFTEFSLSSHTTVFWFKSPRVLFFEYFIFLTKLSLSLPVEKFILNRFLLTTALRPYPIQTKLEMRMNFYVDQMLTIILAFVSFQWGIWNENKDCYHHWFVNHPHNGGSATYLLIISCCFLESRTLSVMLSWEMITHALSWMRGSGRDLYPFLRIITLGHILMNTLKIYMFFVYTFRTQNIRFEIFSLQDSFSVCSLCMIYVSVHLLEWEDGWFSLFSLWFEHDWG